MRETRGKRNLVVASSASTEENIDFVDEENAWREFATHRKEGSNQLLTLSEIHVHQSGSILHRIHKRVTIED